MALASSLSYCPHAGLMAFVCQLCMYYADLYDLRVALSSRMLLIKLGQSLGVAAVVLMGVFYLLPQLSVGRGFLFQPDASFWTAVWLAPVLSGIAHHQPFSYQSLDHWHQ